MKNHKGSIRTSLIAVLLGGGYYTFAPSSNTGVLLMLATSVVLMMIGSLLLFLAEQQKVKVDNQRQRARGQKTAEHWEAHAEEARHYSVLQTCAGIACLLAFLGTLIAFMAAAFVAAP